MIKRNPHFAKLSSGYLFPEINKRKQAFLKRFPNAQLISLGIGDTTEPIPPSITNSLVEAAKALGTYEGYTGYGPEQGIAELRQSLSSIYYHGKIKADDIFISDGSKCDIGRMQVLFGSEATVAVQDPSYPVYVDTSVIIGKAERYNPLSRQYEGVIYMPCLPENNFFPDLRSTPRTDLIYFCSPNNPTGVAASKKELTELIAFAKKNRSILIYDAAYSIYIQDPNIPKSIYEIEGAEEVAIELGSFSKMIGFTGVRLGWTVFPEKLCYEEGDSIKKDWQRMTNTCFNGASNIAQKGAISVLKEEGMKEMHDLIHFYMENCRLLKESFTNLGYSVYGGINAPYIWIKFPNRSSWEVFDELLEKCHLVTTPGAGFGPGGEQFIRASAFGCRENILEAIRRIAALPMGIRSPVSQ